MQCTEYPDFYLVNFYIPNSGQKLDRLDHREKWDADFLKYLKNLENSKSAISCDDFNATHPPIDLKNDKANYSKTAGYTQIEIDGMDNLISYSLNDKIRFVNIHPEIIGSEHCPIGIEIDL